MAKTNESFHEVLIRKETQHDIATIRALLAKVFPSDSEAQLVDALCRAGNLSVVLVAELNGRIIGAVLRTRRNVKPLFVSAGHKSNLADSIRLVMACCAGYRITEPIRRAHALVTRLRSERDAG